MIHGPQAGKRASILLLCQVLPYPLDAGPKVRAYHVLRWLAARTDLTLVCFARDDDPPEAAEHLRGLCAGFVAVPMRRSIWRDLTSLLHALFTGRSFIVLRDERRAMREALATLSRATPFDAVHADQLWMAAYARDLAVPYRVLDDHNAVFRVFERLATHEPSPLKRWLWRREARRLASYEAAQLNAFDHTFFVSEEDRQAVLAERVDRRPLPAASTSVLPICLDTARIEPLRLDPRARHIVMLGTMFWPPNAEGAIWFAERVFDHVLRAVPDARLTVIGKRPPEALRAALSRFGAAAELAGYVEDPRPYLEATAVFAVPLRSGGGMRVKILDAWAWRLPVLSTSLGAEGIQVQPGQDILIADDPAAFAEAAIRLLRDADLRRELAEAGRRAVEARYDVDRVYAGLEAAYGRLLGEER